MSVFETVHPALARALEARGFEALTSVQDAVLAPGAQGVDLVVSAQTGSGKTVAFGLNLASTLLGDEERFEQAGNPLALIIAPTRELAMQVRGELEWLYAQAGVRMASCIGGMDMREERRALERGAHIVVGTPGRLADHIRRGSLDMQHLRAIVLDEADEMLNLGFREELEFILEAAPAERRTLMFSATMPRAIEALAKTYQRDAVRVNTVSAQKQHADIEYRALMTAAHDAENAIFNVLRFYNAANAIVFCGTRAAVTRLESRLSNRGLSVVALSGELSQSARTHALQALRDHRAQICVATDVAARGIDLPDLELVVHADLPKNTEGLLHRSGRTGRAGRKGASVLIVPYPARRRTERLLNDARIQAHWGEPPSAEDIRRRDDQRLLSDALLQAQPEPSERAVVRALLEQHDPAQIAAAFVRLYRKGQAAPEDLTPSSFVRDEPVRGKLERGPREANERARSQNENFVGGAWVSLSVGRNKQAEPRWLIPMLCKAGGLSKRQLGSIRIHDHETHVEIDAMSMEGFMARVGEGGTLEQNIRVTRLDHALAQEAKPRRDFGDKPKRRDDRTPPQREARHERPKFDGQKFEGKKKFDGPKPGKRDRKAQDGKHAKPQRADHKKPKAKWHPAD